MKYPLILILGLCSSLVSSFDDTKSLPIKKNNLAQKFEESKEFDTFRKKMYLYSVAFNNFVTFIQENDDHSSQSFYHKKDYFKKALYKAYQEFLESVPETIPKDFFLDPKIYEKYGINKDFLCNIQKFKSFSLTLLSQGKDEKSMFLPYFSYGPNKIVPLSIKNKYGQEISVDRPYLGSHLNIMGLLGIPSILSRIPIAIEPMHNAHQASNLASNSLVRFREFSCSTNISQKESKLMLEKNFFSDSSEENEDIDKDISPAIFSSKGLAEHDKLHYQEVILPFIFLLRHYDIYKVEDTKDFDNLYHSLYNEFSKSGVLNEFFKDFDQEEIYEEFDPEEIDAAEDHFFHRHIFDALSKRPELISALFTPSFNIIKKIFLLEKLNNRKTGLLSLGHYFLFHESYPRLGGKVATEYIFENNWITGLNQTFILDFVIDIVFSKMETHLNNRVFLQEPKQGQQKKKSEQMLKYDFNIWYNGLCKNSSVPLHLKKYYKEAITDQIHHLLLESDSFINSFYQESFDKKRPQGNAHKEGITFEPSFLSKKRRSQLVTKITENFKSRFCQFPLHNLEENSHKEDLNQKFFLSLREKPYLPRMMANFRNLTTGLSRAIYSLRNKLKSKEGYCLNQYPQYEQNQELIQFTKLESSKMWSKDHPWMEIDKYLKIFYKKLLSQQYKLNLKYLKAHPKFKK